MNADDPRQITVIHVRDYDPANPRHVYIGRAVPRRGFKASPWANPFPIGPGYSRAQSLEGFETWLRYCEDPRAYWINEHLDDLDGCSCACWCKPRDCHGDVYVKLLKEREAAR